MPGSRTILAAVLIAVIALLLVAGCMEKPLPPKANAATPTPTTSKLILPKTTSTPSKLVPTFTPTASRTMPRPPPAPSREEQFAKNVKSAMDYTDPTTRDYALSLIDKSHSGARNIAQVCDMWDHVYKRWTYVSDPNGHEYISPASRTIKLNLKGDCDDFAVLIASLIQATGGSARIVTAYNAQGEGHAYPEVYITSSKADFERIADYIMSRYKCNRVAYHTQQDREGKTRYWLNLDWSARHPGGKFFHDGGQITVYYPNGYWERVAIR